MNITNGYNFLGQPLKSLEYCDGAINISKSQINHLMLILDNPSVNQEAMS
jgi:hypothetical protein